MKTFAHAHRLALLTALVCSLPVAAQARLREDVRGQQLYERECAACHGPSGRGDGPEAASFAPPPRDLREGFLRLYDPDELIARIRKGEPLVIDIDPAAMRRRTAAIEEILAHVRRLPDVRWDDVAAGAAIYSERCEECHGPFGRPPQPAQPSTKAGTPRDLSSPEFQRSTSDAQLLELAQHGRGDMPSLPPISKADVNALRAYLRLMSPGFELYSVWCAGCHGDDGLGKGELAVGTDVPNVIFDRAFVRARSKDELRRQILHMLERQDGAMPHLQHRLSDEQARSVVEYLRAKGGPSPSPSK